MNSVSKIVEMINSSSSPIEIMDNESFSVPFIIEYKGKLCVTVFSYSSQFGFGNNKAKLYVNKVYYINPNDILDYEAVDSRDIKLISEKIPLFYRTVVRQEGMTPSMKYQRLVELTDYIISDSGDIKAVVAEYADLISNTLSEELKIYYISLGYGYFMALNKILM